MPAPLSSAVNTGAVQYIDQNGITNGDSNLVWDSSSEILTATSGLIGGMSISQSKIGMLNTSLVELDSDAATKGYADSVAAGVSWTVSVKLASTVNVLTAWPPGLGSNPTYLTVDGINLAIGDRVLIKNQYSDPRQNGIYIVDISPTGWTRADDLAEFSNAKSIAMLVTHGRTQEQAQFVCNTLGDPIVGNVGGTTGDDLSFVEFSRGDYIVAGPGFYKTGNYLGVLVDEYTITIDDSALHVTYRGISNDELGLLSVGNDNLIDSSVTYDKIQNGSIYGNKITAGGVTGSRLADGSITTIKIEDLNITNGKLLNSTLTFTSGDGMQAPGTVSLGGSIPLSVNSTVLRTTGMQTITGIDTFSNVQNATTSQTGAIRISSGGLGVKQDIFSDGKITGLTISDGIAQLNNGTLRGLVTPSENSDASNKKYVDDNVIGLVWKGAVKAASVSEYTPWPPSGLGTVPSIDNVGLSNLDRVLIKDQNSNKINNGIWVVLSAGPWARASDMKNGSNGRGASVYVNSGNLNIGNSYTVTDSSATVNLNTLTFVKFAGNIQIDNGPGLNKSGNVLSAKVDGSTISLSGAADSIQVTDGGITVVKLASDSVITDKILDSNVTNIKLANSSLTVTAGNGLSGGGSVSLGGVTTLSANVDNSTIEIDDVSGKLLVKSLGITEGKLAGEIPNSKLLNSSLTVTGGDGLSGGGEISLGGTASVSVNSTVLRTTGNQSMTGIQTITNSTEGSITNGALVISGGIKVVKNIYSSASIIGENFTTSTGGVVIDSNKITLTGAISNDTQAATKKYVDDAALGIFWLEPVQVATISELNLSSVSGTIDSATIATGDRVLVKNQTTVNPGAGQDGAKDNGIYIVPAGEPPYNLNTRSADMISGNAKNSSTYVEKGSTNGSGSFIVTSDSPDIGNSDIVFTQFAGGATIIPVDGLYKSGNEIGITTGGVGPTLLADTVVTPGSYGDNLNVPTIVVDQQGRIVGSSANAIPDAGASQKGLVSIGAQTFSGDKTFSDSVEGNVLTDGTATLTSGNLTATNLTGGTITDGVFSSTAGAVTGVVSMVMAGALSGATSVTGNFITDGTATLTAGELTATSLTGTTLTDGTATLTTGVLTGVSSIGMNGPLTGATSVSGTTITDGTATLTGGNLESIGNLTATVLTGDTITDGIFSSVAGVLTGVGSLDMTGILTGATSISSGTITDGIAIMTGGNLEATSLEGNFITDGTATLTAGELTATSLTGTTLTDGTATLTTGGLTGVTTLEMSGDLTGASSINSGNITDGTATLTNGALVGLTTIEASGQITTDSSIRMKETAGTQFITIQAPASIGDNYILTFPEDEGTVGQVLSTGTTTPGVMEWVTQSGGGGTPVGPSNSIQFNDGEAFGGSGSLTWVGSTLNAANLTSSGIISGNFITDGTATLTGGVLTSVSRVGGLINPPVNNSDAASKEYVDSVANGLVWKLPVRVASTFNYGTWPPNSFDTVSSIDTVDLVNGDRVLIKDQTNLEENGIWIASSSVTWNRASDMPSGTDATKAAVFIDEGENNGGASYTNTSTSPNVGTSDITFVKFADNGIGAGDGLLKTGAVLSVDTTVLRTSGDQSASGIQTFTSTAASTSKDSGAVIIQGGLGVEENINAGGIIEGTAITDGTTSLTNGALSATSLTGNFITDGTATLTAGALTGTASLSATSVTGTTITDGTATLTAGALTGTESLSATSVTGTTITDGTATLTAGALTGTASLSATSVTGNFITDGTATLTAGALSSITTIGAASLTAIGAVEGSTITDGTATLTAGELTGTASLSATSVTGTTITDGTTTLTAGSLTGIGSITATSMTGTAITDGTATLTAGVLTGTASITATSMTGTTITDGTASLTAGSLTGIGSITATSMTGTTITDGTATLTSGALTGVASLGMAGALAGATTIEASGQITTDTSLRMKETAGDNTHFVTMQAPASIGANYTLTFPVDDGTTGQVLSTGTIPGTMEWVTVGGGGGGTPVGTINSIQFNDAGAFGGSANLTWDGSDLGIKGDVLLNGATSGAITLHAPNVVDPYTITLPAQGSSAAGQYMVANSAGELDWADQSFGAIPGPQKAISTSPSGSWIHITWIPEMGFFIATAGSSNAVGVSADGLIWATYSSGLSGTSSKAAYGNGLIIIVSKNLTTNVSTSPDGINWTPYSSNIAARGWGGVAWSETLNLFAVASVTGDDEDNFMTSETGTSGSWTGITLPDNNWGSWKYLTYAPEISTFISGTNNGYSQQTYSTDGVNWIKTVSVFATDAAAWSKELNLFVAVGSGANTGIKTSINGIDWISRTDDKCTSVTWSSSMGSFIAVGNSDNLLYSPDGITWTEGPAMNTTLAGIAASDELNIVVAVGTTGFIEIKKGISADSLLIESSLKLRETTSTEPAKTISLQAPETVTAPYTIILPDSVASAGQYLTDSTGTGVLSWDTPPTIPTFDKIVSSFEEPITNLTGSSWSKLIWIPEKDFYIAIGYHSSIVGKSSDALTWSTIESGITASPRNVVYSPFLDLILIISSQTGNSIATSSDGTNWTAYTPTNDRRWGGVSWSEELSLFVAVAYLGSNVDAVMTSPDGLNPWTSYTVPAAGGVDEPTWNDVIWSPEKSLFVAVAHTGNKQVMTSTNGTSWTLQDSATASYRNVAWSKDLGIFAATGGGIITSPDGITWESKTKPAGIWEVIIWSDSIKRFYMVTSGSVGYSIDGETWTSESSAPSLYGLTETPNMVVCIGYGTTHIVLIKNISYYKGEIRLDTLLKFRETGGDLTETIAIKAPETVTAPYTIILPPAVGAANTVLTDVSGDGVLSWGEVGTGGYEYTLVNAASYTLLDTDEFIGVTYTSTGSVALTLPIISGVGLKRYYVTDEGGNAGTFDITITSNVADTINGAADYVISSNYNSISLYNNGGTGWFIA
jgi:hypothetical protein